METAARRYFDSVGHPAVDRYLESHGLTQAQVRPYRLGYVAKPVDNSHNGFTGMLAIPYLRQNGLGEWRVIQLKFRCLTEGCDHNNHSGSKYAQVGGQTLHLYNTTELVRHHDEIALCEGEIDTIAATVAGVPAVGLPGANSWQDHYAIVFEGLKTVRVFPDGDLGGAEMWKTVSGSLNNAHRTDLGQGHDVCSWIKAHSAEQFRGLTTLGL